MNRDKNIGNRGMWISLCCGFLILGLAACSLPGTGADDPEPTVTGGESQEVELGQQEQALKKGECPAEETAYKIWYSHKAVFDSGDQGKERIHFEWKEKQPAYFYIVVEPSGKVTSEYISNLVTIDVSGWVKSDSGSCPVGTFQGAWTLSADFTGTCKKGIVTMKVIEHFEDDELTGSCGDPIGMPGRTSAPEMTLTFDLSEPGPMDGMTVGSEGSTMFFEYTYHLVSKGLSPSELPIPKLPIPDTE